MALAPARRVTPTAASDPEAAPQRPLRTRAEFEAFRREEAEAMAADGDLRRDALDVLVRADRHSWIHQTNWFGEPVINLPQDLFALQEILFRTRPKFVIEAGVAWGGSLLFYSALMEVLGGERVIGIDLIVPPDLRARLGRFGSVSRRLELIEGSTLAETTLDRVKAVLAGSRDVLVVLDSNHTHQHVLAELQLYSPFVGRGNYLVCSDTVVEDIPPQTHRRRPWGPGDNPKTAVRAFLRDNARFEIDPEFEKKYLFTCNPEGYLRCVID